MGQDTLKVGIVGSRKYENRKKIKEFIFKLKNDKGNDTIIVSGGCKQGADYYAKKLNVSLNPNQILIGIGSKSLLFSMIHAIDGDILLPKPSWVSYSSIAKLTGKKITRFDLDRDHGFRLSIDSVISGYDSAKSSGQNPKMLVQEQDYVRAAGQKVHMYL